MVSILVLMDDGILRKYKIFNGKRLQVSILVLMDDGILHIKIFESNHKGCFNPCFNG